MLDPIDAYEKTTTCPFCQTKFSDVVKFIPDCGKFICGACYDELVKDIDESRNYECQACDDQHILPTAGLADCTQLVYLLRHPIEKPLSKLGKKLKRMVESVQEEMAKLNSFDAKDFIEHQAIQLELEIRQTAESAVKHIHQIEDDLLKQVQTNRQRCLDALNDQVSDKPKTSKDQKPATSSTTNDEDIGTRQKALTKEIKEFSSKWDDYFKRLNSLASDKELQAAVRQESDFQDRIRRLEKEMQIRASNGALMYFRVKESFFSARDHLGKLSNQVIPKKNSGRLLSSRVFN